MIPVSAYAGPDVIGKWRIWVTVGDTTTVLSVGDALELANKWEAELDGDEQADAMRRLAAICLSKGVAQ